MLGTVFAVIGAVTVVLVILITSALANLEHARNDRVDRYGPAALATETLSKAYSDQETGLRGFALAGEDCVPGPVHAGPGVGAAAGAEPAQAAGDSTRPARAARPM